MKRAKQNKTAPVPIADAPVAAIVKPFTFRVTVRENTHLHVGDVVSLSGRDHVIKSVNECCARAVPITEGAPKAVTFTPRFADKPITFTAPERNASINISANSELDIKRRLGANWRERL